MDESARLRVRAYGTAGRLVMVLHGGPGAAGEAAPLARGLAGEFRVLEPWQRPSGGEPLSVARHVADLRELVQSRCEGERPALVGHSWGAMLALAYAAEHPDAAGPLVLVGCGTFDTSARARMQAILDERTSDDLRQRLHRLAQQFPNPDEQLTKRYELTKSLYLVDPIADEPEETGPVDIRAHLQTWADMLRLQAAGVYPAAFAKITAPVLMLHGAQDPHPGPMIRASLAAYLPRLEYREWDHCGHYPWLERHVRDEFFAALRAWLASKWPSVIPGGTPVGNALRGVPWIATDAATPPPGTPRSAFPTDHPVPSWNCANPFRCTPNP
jgi:pimeloyl-ACP methyl ester carboxylesterase